jgi:hypothetical protein
LLPLQPPTVGAASVARSFAPGAGSFAEYSAQCTAAGKTPVAFAHFADNSPLTPLSLPGFAGPVLFSLARFPSQSASSFRFLDFKMRLTERVRFFCGIFFQISDVVVVKFRDFVKHGEVFMGTYTASRADWSQQKSNVLGL